jgi:hypothetical protein
VHFRVLPPPEAGIVPEMKSLIGAALGIEYRQRPLEMIAGLDEFSGNQARYAGDAGWPGFAPT